MSSSGSRGPPLNRYGSDDYHKLKRKNFYPSRRTLSSSGPSSSTTGPNPTSSPNGGPSSAPGTSNGPSGTVGPKKPYGSSYGSKYNTYYPSYGSYNTFRRDRDSSNPGPNSASTGADMDGSSSGYSRSTDRYDSYSKNYSRPSLSNRSSLSNSIPKRDRSRNNSLLNSKRSDTYYPSKTYFNKSQVDHYSTKKKYQYQANSQHYSSYDSGSGYNQNYNFNYKKSDDDSSSGLSRKNTESPNDISNRQGSRDYDPEHRDMESPEPSKHEHQDHELHGNDDDDDRNDHDDYSYTNNSDDEEERSEEKQSEAAKPVESNDNDEDQMSEDDMQSLDQMQIDMPAPSKDLEPGKQLEVQPEVKQEHLNQEENNTGVEVILSDQFPLNRMDSKLAELKQEFDSKKIVSKYNKVHDDIKAYPFYRRNLQIYHYQKKKIVSFIQSNNEDVKRLKLSLWKQYKALLKTWEKERVNMDQQLAVLHPPNDEMKRELEMADIRIKGQVYGEGSSVPTTPNPNGSSSSNNTNITPGNSSTTGESQAPDPSFEDTIVTGGFGNRRSSRRHGDLVTTEAEFEEVLKNLSKQDDDDPVLKALKVSAPVPDLLLDPNEMVLQEYLDSNNIVRDKQEWSSRVRTQFFDTFSPEEHSLFCEGYVKYPKKFGYISKYMGGLRTFRECVIHYYLTKKGVNYKNLILQYKKKVTKKPVKKRVKSRNTSVNNTPVDSNRSEAMEENDDGGNEEEPAAEPALDKDTIKVAVPTPNQVETFGEELFTETGRRKRAAAPSFEDGQTSAKRNKHTVEFEVDANSPIQLNEVKKRGNRRKKEEHKSPLTPKDTPKEGEMESGALMSMGEEGLSEAELKERMNNRNKGHSSYWSITEANEFPVLLKQYGKKWTTIADILATKTPTMVRNYYHRNCDKYNWRELAENADKRLEQKFASISKPEDEESEIPPPQLVPQIDSQPRPTPQQMPFQIQGYAVNTNASVMPPGHSGAPVLGTFGNRPHFPPQPQYPIQYPPVQSQQGSFQSGLGIHTMPYQPASHTQSQSPPQVQAQQAFPTYIQPQPASFSTLNKPSIGSLINTDKPELHLPPKESHKPSIMSLLNTDSPTKSPSTPEAPATNAPANRNNINSLLNSPSTNEKPSQDPPHTLPKLSAILADSNDQK